MRKFIISLLALFVFVVAGRADDAPQGVTVANWQFTSSWYFGLLPDYEVIQPIRLMDASGNDVTAQCLNNVTFTSSEPLSISVSKVPAGHNSGMTGYWKLKAGSTKGNATITGTYSGSTQWGQAASQGFTVFCGDPTDASWAQNNMFGIDPILVYAAAGTTIEMPTITVGGSHNALTDFDILYVRSSNKDNVEVIHPAYNNAGVLLHGYQFKVNKTTATRIWIEVKGKGNYTGYWAKIYFNINGMTVSTSGSQNGGDGQNTGDADQDPNADPVIVPEGQGGGDTPVTPTTYSVKIPVPNYVLAAGQTIHQTPKVIKTDKDGSNVTTTDVSSYYGFSYSCDRPDYAYVAADGTVTALKEIKEPIYINVKATPTEDGVTAGCKEASTSYSIQIYSSESVIRLNPDSLTIPMGESRLVPSLIMKVNGTVYEPNQENTYALSYEGFDPSIVALVDEDGKVQGINNDFDMAKAKSFKALQSGTTQGVVHARGQGINSAFWGTAPFRITVKASGGDAPSAGAIREISIPVPFYTMAYGNTIHQRIKVKEYADAEAKENNQYTDVTSQYTLSYESSNTQVATVDANGVVTAVADNVNPAYIKVTASPTDGTSTVNPASFGVKVFGGASVISLSQRNITLAPNELVPLPEVFVTIDGIKYSTENAFNLHYEINNTSYAEIVENTKLRGIAVGNTTVTVKIVGKGEFEGFYATTLFDVIVRTSETLDGANTWYWAQDGARSSIYDLYPGKQLHFKFENKSIDANNNTGWVFVASKTPGYSDQAFLAANPFQNYITWDGWGEHANPQPVLNNGTYDLATFETDLKNAHVDYIVSLGADGQKLSINATIEAKNAQNETVRTYTYTIANKQLSYAVNVLPVYFSSVRSTIETLRLVPQTYTATAKVEGDGGKVKIMVNGQDQMDGENYKTTVEEVEEGSHVVFMAVPNGNEQAGGTEGRYYFVKWSEDNSTNITRDFYIDQDISLTATFRANEKKWLDVTTDGQDYLLNKNNYDNDYFFKIKKGETVFAEGQWLEIASLGQTLTSLYGTDNRHIDLYVRGAKAFRVYAYDNNGTESTYTVKVDNGEAATVNHHGTALETSPIFPISETVAVGTEGETVNTITLMGDDDQLYPFIVQFFIKNIITQTDKRQHVTTADGVADEAIAASTLASAGTLTSVTYANSKDREIATAEVVNGKLVITGKKAGNIIVKLNFTGGDDYSNATFDYTIIVKKRDVRLSWNKKSINLHYNADPEAPQGRASEDWAQFATLHYTEYAPDGKDTIYNEDATAPNGVTVTYTSTDNTLIYFSNGTPVFCKTTGTADIIARISEDDQFLDNAATICINITPMGGIYYEVNTDDKPEEGEGKQGDLKKGEGAVVASFDMHVYKYNNKLAAKGEKESLLNTHKDIWGDVKEYQGSDAMKKVWYMDGFSYNTQGNQNAMNENFRLSKEEYNIQFDGTDYAIIKPFSLPVRGSFVKFEALQNGTLICYALQNGNLNFNHISEYENKKNNPLASNPRLYYWFDQEGNNMQGTVTASTKQPLAIGKRDDLPELTEKVKEFCTDDHIKEIYNNFPSQAEVDRNLEKNVPDPQPIITHKGGYTIMNKAYVKYEVPVRMGNTYYFFSNDSKVGFAGVKFEPAAQQPTATLAMTQNDDWSTTASQSNANGMAQHKGNSFATATLARSFKKDQWNTICLPFCVSEKQVEEVFGVGTQLLIYDGIKEIEGQRVAQFLRHVDQNILAGQPYFIYTTGEGVNNENTDVNGNITKLEFHNITVPSDLHVRSYGNDDENGLRMVGTLSKTNVNPYDYYVNASTGAITRYTGTAATQLNTYRAFLQQTHPSPQNAFMFGFTDIEAEAEGIETRLLPVVNELGIGKHLHDGIYNLNGQKLSDDTESLERGIYIINNKKVIK